jgi:uncharacterized protein (TIGR02996 family)
MTDGDALFAAILAAPDDDLPRLAFADWLDEHGDPDRAAFIRVQIELAHLPAGTIESDRRLLELRVAEKTLLTRNRVAWLAPLRRPGEALEIPATHAIFRRGFVELVWMSAGWFVWRAEALFRRTPARELRVTGGTLAKVSELLACPYLARLDTLLLDGRWPGDEVAARVAESPLVAGLRALWLGNCGLTDGGAARLAAAPFDWHPRELDVSHNPIGEAGLAALRARYGAAVVPRPPAVSSV